MRHIYKSLKIITLLLIFVVSSGLAVGNGNILDSVSQALQKDGGTLIEATIEQRQQDKDWTDYVTVEIIDSTKFVFIASDQIIKVDLDTVYTFTPNTNQLVIDYYFRNEFNMLSLLSGNLHQITLGKVNKRARDTIIDFTIPQIESRGKIWINSTTYNPMRIVLEDDLENHTTIIIDSVHPLKLKNQYDEYVPDGWEIIDLRE